MTVRIDNRFENFAAFLAKVDHYLSSWQVLKKSVGGNVLGANILNVITKRDPGFLTARNLKESQLSPSATTETTGNLS